MGLFKKKDCDICGEQIKFFARKVEDGNICKACAAKLSPWFSERRKSTLADIRAQLDYRQENEQAVSQFHVTRTIGDNYKVLLDEDARKFLVTNQRKWQEGNPDVLDFSMVTGVTLNTDEHEHELMRKGADGKEVSYNPPMYEYSYDFEVTIHVNHPYFDEMSFQINSSAVDAGKQSIGRGNAANPEIRMYQDMADEIKEALLNARQEARDEKIAANAPKQAVNCPSCGATTVPDANGCCEYCGSALG